MSLLFLRQRAKHPGRHAARHRIGRHVLRHDGARRNDRAVADRDAGQDRHIRTDPRVFPDADRPGDQVLPIAHGETVVQRGQHDVVPDQRAVVDHDAALVLKFAPAVDEDVFPDRDVLAAVRVKRREQRERVVHRPAGQRRKNAPHFLRRMVSAVQLCRPPQGLLRERAHAQVRFRAALDGFSAVHMVQKCLQIHRNPPF